MDTPDPRPSAARRYVVAWASLAVVGLLLAYLVGPRADPSLAWWVPVALVALTVVGEGTELVLRHRRSAEAITLLEVAVVVDVLLLPPWQAIGVVMLAIGIFHAGRRRGLDKVAFNVGMHGTSATLMAGIVALGGQGGAIITPTRVGLVLAGVTVFGLVNHGAMAGLLARFEGVPARSLLAERIRFVVAQVLGNGVVGVIAVALGTQYPWLVPLVATPVIALHLTYRGVARSESLLADVRAERDLRDRVLGGASDGIALLDADGVIQLWNPAMARITGHAADEVIGRSALDVIAARDDEGAPIDPTSPLSTATDPARPTWSSEVLLERPDGQTLDARLLHTVIFDERGQPSGDIVILRDLSRDHEVRSLKQDFVARVSHELRTPLTPIRGYAQVMLKSHDRLEPEVRERGLRAIIDRVAHMTRLIDDLLLAARVSADDPRVLTEIEPVPMDLVARAEEIVGWFDRDLVDRRFEVRSRPDLPPALADPLRVGQVVTNLVSNACKYSDASTPVVVEVDLLDPRTLALGVIDQGVGIPPDELDRIFEQFHRLEPPDLMQTSGIGLGLYIARHLAIAMDGDLQVESEVGVGSRFTLHLPVSTTPVSPPHEVGDRPHEHAS